MVDVGTYWQYRRRKDKLNLSSTYQLGITDSDPSEPDKEGSVYVGPARFDWEHFPDSPELLVFPFTIIGYDLRRKIWGK